MTDELMAQLEAESTSSDTGHIGPEMVAALVRDLSPGDAGLQQVKKAVTLFDHPWQQVLLALVKDRQEGREISRKDIRDAMVRVNEGVPGNLEPPFPVPDEVAREIGTLGVETGLVLADLEHEQEHRARQEMVQRLDGYKHLLQDGRITDDKFSQLVTGLLEDHESGTRKADVPAPESQVLPGLLMGLEARQQGKAFIGLDSGFKYLNLTTNGLDEGLYVLAAMPGAGKTTYLTQMAFQVAKGNPDSLVVFISMEQGRQELHVKNLSRLARVDGTMLLRGRFKRSENGWQKTLGAVPDHLDQCRNVIIIEGGNKTTTGEIRSILSSLQGKYPGRKIALFVDYLQIIPTSKDECPHDRTKDRIDYLVSEFRRIARDYTCPVVMVSQVNRQSYEAARMASFKESGNIEYTADVAMLLVTDPGRTEDIRNKNKYSPVARVVSLKVMKNRNGERKQIEMIFEPEYATFTEKKAEDLKEEEKGSS